jgi:TolB protein
VTSPLSNTALKAQAAEVDEALLFDLSAAGVFQVLDRKSFLADPKEGLSAGSIQFARWADVGAEALLKTSLERDGNSLRGELRLYSVGPGKEELKVNHVVPLAEARRLAHHFADALFRFYTREPGPFRSRMAFVKKTPQGKDVWLADWDGANAAPVTSGGINLLPTVTPDGNAVAFTSYRRNRPEIYVQAPGRPPTPVITGGQMATGASFSPDGRRIAYSLAEGEGAQIWVANADGSGAHPITDTPYFINSSPSWAPDGKRLAFVSNRGGSPQIYVMNDEGGQVRRLTFKGDYNQTPDWSPRGDLIAFTARDERNAFDLFTVNPDSGEIKRLTQDQGNNEEPSFAPNGRLILFTSTRTGSPRLFVMTADGNNQHLLPINDKLGLLTPVWGPLVKD